MNGKKIRQKGKIKLSQYLKKIDDGARVAIVQEQAVRSAFPKRIVGQSGNVTGSRGKFKLVKIKDGDKVKTFIMHPVHLKDICNGGQRGRDKSDKDEKIP